MRRGLVALGAFAAAALGAVFACGFPSPDFTDEAPLVDAGSAEDVDASALDANTTTCKGDPDCDCDGDGDLSLACDGGDCDDQDERVRSTQTGFIAALSTGPGDWNCDNTIEYEVEAGVVCSLLLDGGPRDAGEVDQACAREGFFEPNQACGTEGRYVECEPAKEQGNTPKTCREKSRSRNDFRTRACR